MPRPRNPRIRRLAAIVLVFAAAAAGCGDDSDDGISRLGQDEPGLSIEDIQPDVEPGASVDVPFATLDGGEGNLTDFAGTPLVVNFFAAWCPSCVSEMPDFERIFQERDGQVAFLGISEDTQAADSLELIDDTGITYATGWDPDGRIFAGFRSFAMPTTLFIDADGTVAHMFSGALSAESLEDLIDEHIA